MSARDFGSMVIIAIAALIVLSIAGYATFALVRNVRSGKPLLKSVWEWLKRLFEAIWGLG